MFFRFGSALILIVVTSLLGILVEKRNLTLRRELSRQHYRMDVLQEEHARLRLHSQRLAAVERLFAAIEDEDSGLVPVRPGSIQKSPPVMQPGEKSSGEGNPVGLPTAAPDSPKVDSTVPDSSQSDPSESDSSDLTTRRVPLLFWRKPVGDPRLKRDSP